MRATSSNELERCGASRTRCDEQTDTRQVHFGRRLRLRIIKVDDDEDDDDNNDDDKDDEDDDEDDDDDDDDEDDDDQCKKQRIVFIINLSNLKLQKQIYFSLTCKLAAANERTTSTCRGRRLMSRVASTTSAVVSSR